MLNSKEKIKKFTSILNKEEASYADSFNSHINIAGGNCDYKFLKKLNSEKDIEYWVDKLKSRIVMHEDDDMRISRTLWVSPSSVIDIIRKLSILLMVCSVKTMTMKGMTL
ncbi:MAG: hypothetical protein U9N04_02265, partial [Patescibacteria group bacterium]|nr:hypothetical protein [Patescibacteria group bacterium]